MKEEAVFYLGEENFRQRKELSQSCQSRSAAQMFRNGKKASMARAKRAKERVIGDEDGE